MDIYLLQGGEQTGPFTTEEIRGHLASGALPRDIPAWREGMETWAPVHEVMAPATESTKPLPPPPVAVSKTNGSISITIPRARLSWFLYAGLGLVLAFLLFYIFTAYYAGHSLNPATASSKVPSTPAYYGLYSCTEADPDAARLVMKLDSTGFSFIALQNPSDDPATSKVIPQDITVTYLHAGDSVAQMDGTIRQKITTVWTTTGTAPKPSDTTTTTSESEFSLQWYAGKDGKPDTVVLTIIDGKLQSVHFQRRA